MFIYSAAVAVLIFSRPKAWFTSNFCSLICLDIVPVAGEAASGLPAYTGLEYLHLLLTRTASNRLSTKLHDPIFSGSSWHQTISAWGVFEINP